MDLLKEPVCTYWSTDAKGIRVNEHSLLRGSETLWLTLLGTITSNKVCFT